MTGPVVVDTNIVAYRHDSSEAAKQSWADDWHTLSMIDERGRAITSVGWPGSRSYPSIASDRLDPQRRDPP